MISPNEFFSALAYCFRLFKSFMIGGRNYFLLNGRFIELLSPTVQWLGIWQRVPSKSLIRLLCLQQRSHDARAGSPRDIHQWELCIWITWSSRSGSKYKDSRRHICTNVSSGLEVIMQEVGSRLIDKAFAHAWNSLQSLIRIMIML